MNVTRVTALSPVLAGQILLEAALNGTRTRMDHPRIPVAPEHQALAVSQRLRSAT